MNRVCSIFQQVVQIFSRAEFDLAVRQHKANRYALGLINWVQFTDMLLVEISSYARPLAGRCRIWWRCCGSNYSLTAILAG
jgi:hypothetical protein